MNSNSETFSVNYVEESGKTVQGIISFNDEGVLFTPGKANFGTCVPHQISYKSMIGAVEGSAGNVAFVRNDGSMFSIKTWNSSAMINEVKNRFISYYKNQGLEVPEFKYEEQNSKLLGFIPIPKGKVGLAILVSIFLILILISECS